MATPIAPPMSKLLMDVAIRDGLCVDEVLTLCLRWVYPFVWDVESAIEKAIMDDPAWQAWRQHHNELCAHGYHWPMVKV